MTPETVKMLDFFWTLGLGNYFIGLVFCIWGIFRPNYQHYFGNVQFYQNGVTRIEILMLLL